MKLLAIEMSRVVSLFRIARRSGQLYEPHAAALLAGRYSFSNAPKSFEDLRENKILFQHGLFEGNAIDTLEIYNDGIVVTSKSDSGFIDEFLDDLRSWVDTDLEISVIKTHTVNRIYESNLTVETDRNILKTFGVHDSIARLIETALLDSSGLEIQYENVGVSLSADQAQNPSLNPALFRFERRSGVEFSLNQFYTTAPLKTNQHLEILEELERLA